MYDYIAYDWVAYFIIFILFIIQQCTLNILYDFFLRLYCIWFNNILWIFYIIFYTLHIIFVLYIIFMLYKIFVQYILYNFYRHLHLYIQFLQFVQTHKMSNCIYSYRLL